MNRTDEYARRLRIVVAASILLQSTAATATSEPCKGDLNGDRNVDGADLSLLLVSWGKCEQVELCSADADGDGMVGGSDLALLLAGWGECPPMVSDPGWTDLPSLLAEDSRIVYIANNEIDAALALSRVPVWRVQGAHANGVPISIGVDGVLYSKSSSVLGDFGVGHTDGQSPLPPNLSPEGAEAILSGLGVDLDAGVVTLFSWHDPESQKLHLAVAMTAVDSPVTINLSGASWRAGDRGVFSTHDLLVWGSNTAVVATLDAGSDFMVVLGGFQPGASIPLVTLEASTEGTSLPSVHLTWTDGNYEVAATSSPHSSFGLGMLSPALAGLPIVNQHGRGYYLPNDPEIGPDPTNPLGPIVAHREPLGALRALGENRAISPDWVLFKRGDDFDAQLIDSSIPYGGGAGNLGTMFRLGYANSLQGFHESAGFRRGVSPEAPFVVAAWGDESLARPRIRGGFSKPLSIINCVIASLDFSGREDSFNFFGGGSSSTPHAHTLLEDCILARGNPGSAAFGGPVIVRRCIIDGAWNAYSHVQGVFLYRDGQISSGAVDFTFEECILDLNGYKEDPFDPSTWSADAVSNTIAGELPVGSGVQPTRTWFDRNIYVATGDGIDHSRVVLRGSIVSRGGGGGSVQMRQGGLSERNAFLWNEDVGFVSSGAGGVFARNLLLHDDHMRPPGGWGKGVGSWANHDIGTQEFVVDDNVLAHFHRGLNGNSPLGRSGSFYSREGHAGASVVLSNNAVFRQQGYGLAFDNNSMGLVAVGGNKIAMASGELARGAVSGSDGTEYPIGDGAVGGNLYWSQSATPFGGGLTFAQWQARRSGLDSESRFFADFDEFKSVAGWTDPERDLVSYMQSVDPTFVPNEDVTTDDGVPADKRRPDAQKVREVMQSTGMSDAEARLTARRYHAFITFIERAKANRKGAWDPAYTADSLNNYIREGFGKEPVGGPYTTAYPGD